MEEHIILIVGRGGPPVVTHRQELALLAAPAMLAQGYSNLMFITYKRVGDDRVWTIVNKCAVVLEDDVVSLEPVVH